MIDELAATLGVSQIPIREAMRQLEGDGFVTIEPYVGATVAELNADFIFEVFALLEHLEIISSRAACRVMSDDDLQQLADMIEQMEASVTDPEQMVERRIRRCTCSSVAAPTRRWFTR